MIERSYPGVYLVEVAFNAKPIDGVPASQPGADAPAWTDSNAHDPGVSLLGLLGFLAEPVLYRSDLAPHGTVDGLAVESAGSGDAPAVQVSAGVALDPAGREITPGGTDRDLSALVSRYIGETEKNLSATLAAAQSSGALLHHDESRSLFDDWP